MVVVRSRDWPRLAGYAIPLCTHRIKLIRKVNKQIKNEDVRSMGQRRDFPIAAIGEPIALNPEPSTFRLQCPDN
jgi:hypothetical protein